MRSIRSTDTHPEMTVRRMVHRLGFRYKLHDRTLPGKPDLVFPRLRKIIEVRGCFWHQHDACIDGRQPKSQQPYWQPKLAENRKRDERNEAQLRELGWSVLTLWECELKDLKLAKATVLAFLNDEAVRHAGDELLARGVGGEA